MVAPVLRNPFRHILIGSIQNELSRLPCRNKVRGSVVISAADQLKGQVPLGFMVLKSGVIRTPEGIASETVAMVRETIGPVAFFKQVLVVDRLPKTLSGKIPRVTIQKIADGSEWKMPATIEDPDVLGEIASALSPIGYGSGRKARQKEAERNG
jgi:propionyl-CoA synthetase